MKISVILIPKGQLFQLSYFRAENNIILQPSSSVVYDNDCNRENLNFTKIKKKLYAYEKLPITVIKEKADQNTKIFLLLIT